MEVPMYPNELKKQIKKSEFKEFILESRKWTEKEEEWAWELHQQGYTYKQIAYSLGRENSNSVPIKMKRLKKKNYIYNEKHIEKKYKSNNEFLNYMGNRIQTVLDCFCGENRYYTNRGYNSKDNDINKNIQDIMHLDINELLDKEILENNKYDLVDLDAFGATIIYLEKALKLADKGLIMTLGELGHKRWKRLDFISKHYPIYNVEDITIHNMINHIIDIAKNQKIELIPVIVNDYGNIGRVWFEIAKKRIKEANQ